MIKAYILTVTNIIFRGAQEKNIEIPNFLGFFSALFKLPMHVTDHRFEPLSF